MSRESEVTVRADETEGVRESYGTFWLENSDRYVLDGEEEGRFVYDVTDVPVEEFDYLSFDVLAEGTTCPNVGLVFSEGDGSLASWLVPTRDSSANESRVWFQILPECTARCTFSLDVLETTADQLPRRGARLKALVGGDRVDPSAIDRIELLVRTSEEQSWCHTPITFDRDEPAPLGDPSLPSGALLDEYGQWTLGDWDGKVGSESTLVERLRHQRSATDGEPPSDLSQWGGWTERQFEATGFFRTHHDGDRWWLVDPDGHPFVSIGLNTVQPRHLTAYEGLEDALAWLPDDEGRYEDALYDYEGESVVNYLRTNLLRTFGDEAWCEGWAEIVFSHLWSWGFNTAGAWSEWETAREFELPYTRCLEVEFERADEAFAGLPDPFDEDVRADAAAVAAQLEATASDPYMIGYYLGNYGAWTMDEKPPAAGMLERPVALAARDALADALRDEYGTDDTLQRAWGKDVTFDAIRGPERVTVSTDAAREDLVAFSERMVDRLYRTLAEECRAVDDDHLNLGTRFNGVPQPWALASLSHADVFTTYFYGRDVESTTSANHTEFDTDYERISDRYEVPVLVAEWHHGALDVGLPHFGRYVVEDQAARGEAYRNYFERAISKPWCVGSHYFQLYDQSALGRPDGENGNIGLFDVCHRPYSALVEAATASHERAYDVASGLDEPYEWNG